MRKWKEINNYNARYFISDDGKIESRARAKAILLKPRTTSDGYHAVNLCGGGSREYFLVHRLVAQYFVIKKREEQNQVNHINGIKNDNRACNLEWTTQHENMRHAWDNKLIVGRKGESHNLNVLSESTVIKIKEMLRDGIKDCVIVKKLGLKYWHVSDIKRGKTWAWLDINNDNNTKE